jgi:hypothetical protein
MMGKSAVCRPQLRLPRRRRSVRDSLLPCDLPAEHPNLHRRPPHRDEAECDAVAQAETDAGLRRSDAVSGEEDVEDAEDAAAGVRFVPLPSHPARCRERQLSPAGTKHREGRIAHCCEGQREREGERERITRMGMERQRGNSRRAA